MKNKIKGVLVPIVLLGIGFLGVVSFANAQFYQGGSMPQGQGFGMSGGKNFTPSTESVSTCSGKSESDSCSLTISLPFNSNSSNNEKTMNGTCQKNPKDSGELFCMPKLTNNGQKVSSGAMTPGQQGMNGQGGSNRNMNNFASTQSVSACSSKSENDSCSFTISLPSNSNSDNSGSGKTINGTCQKNPQNQDELACTPEATNNNIQDRSIEDRVSKEEEMKKNQISQVEEQTKGIINFLDSKNIDTSEIENDLSTFDSKANDLFSAYDAYIQALKDNNDDQSVDAVKSALSDVGNAKKSLTDYFQTTLKQNIEDALSKLS